MKATGTKFWAIDKVILSYFLLTGLVVVGWWRTLPQAPGLLAWHILGSALVIFQVEMAQPHFLAFSELVSASPTLVTFTKKWLSSFQPCGKAISRSNCRTAGWPAWICEFGAQTPASGWSGFSRQSSPNGSNCFILYFVA